MTNYEYHQLLKFLYFEGYADSYEDASYIAEELSNIEKRQIIFELNRQAKEEGRGKTPLYVGTTKGRGVIEKDPETGKTKMTRYPRQIMNFSAAAGRAKRVFGVHPHGGPLGPGGQTGSKRGVKKQRGVKPGTNIIDTPKGRVVTKGPKAPETPVEKFKKQRQFNKEKEATRYNKYFPSQSTPSPTRLDVLRGRKQQRMSQKEAVEILFDYLLDEGYTYTEDGAMNIIENMSEDWMESILNSY